MIQWFLPTQKLRDRIKISENCESYSYTTPTFILSSFPLFFYPYKKQSRIHYDYT